MKRILLSFFICLSFMANSQSNLLQDSFFESADLTRVFSQTYPSVYYNVWTSHIVSDLAANTTIIVGSDSERNAVAQMSNGGTGIANTNAWKAFIAQRIQMTANPSLYRMSFWAKATAGTPTIRIFVKIAGSTNKFFIFDTDKPTSPTGTYTAFCKNLPLTTSWQNFQYVLDFSKTTTTMGSIAYNTAVAATTDDLTNFAVCLQNNTANSTLQIDEVTLQLETNSAVSTVKSGSEMKILIDGKKLYVANVTGRIEIIDVQGKVIASKKAETDTQFELAKTGLYLVKYKDAVRKFFVK